MKTETSAVDKWTGEAPAIGPTLATIARLIEKLLSLLNRPGGLALLSGPAGFGKTTLLKAGSRLFPGIHL